MTGPNKNATLSPYDLAAVRRNAPNRAEKQMAASTRHPYTLAPTPRFTTVKTAAVGRDKST